MLRAHQLILLGTLVVVIGACSGVGNYSPATYGAGSGVTIASTKVEPTFPYAIYWNSYVLRDQYPSYLSTGIGCSPVLQTDAASCTHAGGQRKFTMPASTTSCAGLSATDNLGVFKWTCVNQSGSIVFFTAGFQTGKGLRDLIDGTNLVFRPNFLSVTGSVTLDSKTSTWWPDRVLPLPTNSGATAQPMVLDTANAVYVATTDTATRGYDIDADGVSVVTLGTSTLGYVGTATANCASVDGTINSPDRTYVLCGGAHKFSWIEAALDTAGVAIDGAAMLVNAPFARFHRTTVTGGDVVLSGLYATRVTDLRANVGDLVLNSTMNGAFANIQLGAGQLTLVSSDGNRFSQVSAAGGQQGVLLQNANENVLSGLTILGTSDSGLSMTGTSSSANVVSFATIANSGATAVNNAAGVDSIFHNVLAANSTASAFTLGASASYSHLGAVDAAVHGIELSASQSKFSGALVTGNNGGTDCDLSGSPTAPGLSAACAGTDASAGLLTYIAGPTSATSFKGKITTTDAVNASNTAGAAASYPASPDSFDWLNFFAVALGPFEPFKLWAADGGTYPALNQRGSWSALGGAGRIWDLSLAAADSTLRTRAAALGGTAAAPSNGLACPAWLAGSLTVTDINSSVVYLANAAEVMFDGVGNDDGLCSSNEVCIAAPNLGSYQGDGDYTARSCTFAAGTVTGVTMYYYPFNGR